MDPVTRTCANNNQQKWARLRVRAAQSRVSPALYGPEPDAGGISRKRHTMATPATARDPYLVKSVVHSSRVLAAFHASGEALPLREIAGRSGLPKSMAFRLLYTLERCGLIEKVGENLYRSS